MSDENQTKLSLSIRWLHESSNWSVIACCQHLTTDGELVELGVVEVDFDSSETTAEMLEWLFEHVSGRVRSMRTEGLLRGAQDPPQGKDEGRTDGAALDLSGSRGPRSGAPRHLATLARRAANLEWCQQMLSGDDDE